ncbi:MAG: M48 family metalloprotease [Succinivibrionaceae bacterium]
MLTIFFIGYGIIVISLTYVLQICYLIYKNIPYNNFDFNVFNNKMFPISILIVSILMILGYLSAKKTLKNSGTELATKLGGINVSLLEKIKNEKELQNKNYDKYISPYELEKLRYLNILEIKQLRNLVEEMSIASNIPVPEIFIDLTSYDINAFATGYDKRKASICVTMGSIKKLNRNELQVLIAHEFSNICNGCMAVSLKTTTLIASMSILFNIGCRIFSPLSTNTKIEKIADFAIRKTRILGPFPILAPIGVIIMFTGLLGQTFGLIMKDILSKKIIKLADITAIKYTRNPVALLRLLNKIKVGNNYVDGILSDYAHLYFTSSESLYSTHPTIMKRIEYIQKYTDSDFSFKKYNYTFDHNILFEKTEDLVDIEKNLRNPNGNKESLDNTINKTPNNILNEISKNAGLGVILTSMMTDKEKEEYKILRTEQEEQQRNNFKNNLQETYKIIGAVFDTDEEYFLFLNHVDKKIAQFFPSHVIRMSMEDTINYIAKLRRFTNNLENNELLRFEKILKIAQQTNPTNYKPNLLSLVVLRPIAGTNEIATSGDNLANSFAIIYSFILNNCDLNKKQRIACFNKCIEAAKINFAVNYYDIVSVSQLVESIKSVYLSVYSFKKNFLLGLDIAIKADDIISDEEIFIIALLRSLHDQLESSLYDEIVSSYSKNEFLKPSEQEKLLTKPYAELLVIIANDISDLNEFINCGNNDFIETIKSPSIEINDQNIRRILTYFNSEFAVANNFIKDSFYKVIKDLTYKELTNTKLLALYAFLLNKNKNVDKIATRFEFNKYATIIFRDVIKNNDSTKIENDEVIFGAMDILNIPRHCYQQIEPTSKEVFQALCFMTKAPDEFKKLLLTGLKAIIDGDGIETIEEIFTYEIMKLLQQ